MILPAPDLRKQTDEEVWQQLHDGSVGSNLHTQARITLELRFLERQAKASVDLAKTTDRLAVFTERLVRATWGLVFVTFVLGLVTVAQVVLALLRAT
jgi:hypothetical protein